MSRLFSAVLSSSEATVRLLPTTSARDSAARLSRLPSGRCQSLVLAGIRGGTWSLGQLCSVLEAATHLAADITSLDFSRMDLDENFLLYVIEFINRCPKLRRLEMEENFFTEASAAALGQALSTMQSLAYVNLSRCNLTDAAAEAFSTAVFRRSGGAKGSAGEAFFAGACGFALHLSHNAITSAFAKSLAATVANPRQHHLNTVSLFGNFISNEDSHAVHSGCQKRRQWAEERRRGGQQKSAVSSPVTTARTSLGLLIECADASEKGAFPTVAAMVQLMAEEEGL